MTIETVPVAITLDNGDLSIMRFITRGRGNVLPNGAIWVSDSWWSREPTTETLAGEIRRAFEAHEAKPVSWRVIQERMVPTDRTYRKSWTDIGGTIAFNMTKARDVHREIIRAARTKAMERLDVEYMAADEDGDISNKREIAARKQRLRDLPADPRIEAAQTIDDLRKVWDEELDS